MPPERLEEIERDAILQALRKHNYNRTDTAKALAISRRSLTYKCRAIVHDDRETLDWVLPEFANAMRPGEPEKAEAFRQMLDSPGRIVFELIPETRIGFDSAKMWKASEAARPSDSRKPSCRCRAVRDALKNPAKC